MAKREIPTKRITPAEIAAMAIGETREVHGMVLGTFKTYVSKAKKIDPTLRIQYSDMVANFVTAKRISNDN